MNEPDTSRYTELLGQLRFVMDTTINFSSSAPETTTDKVRLLTAAATYFNILTVSEHGGRLGPEREAGLVEQVVAATFQTFDGVDPHPSDFDKAAMLLRGIVQGHPFHDGNKRTGFLTATFFLARVGYGLRTDVDKQAIVAFCRAVSAGDIRSLDVIALTIAGWFAPRYGPETTRLAEDHEDG